MGTIMYTIIAVLNLFTIFMLFNLLKNRENSTRLVDTVSIEIIMFILAHIIYFIASLGIPSEVVNASRNLIVFAILPINIIAIGFPLIIINGKEEKKKKDNKKMGYLIATIIIIILETNYLRGMLAGININEKKKANKIEQKMTVNITNDIKNENNNIAANGINNNIANEINNNMANGINNNMYNEKQINNEMKNTLQNTINRNEAR